MRQDGRLKITEMPLPFQLLNDGLAVKTCRQCLRQTEPSASSLALLETLGWAESAAISWNGKVLTCHLNKKSQANQVLHYRDFLFKLLGEIMASFIYKGVLGEHLAASLPMASSPYVGSNLFEDSSTFEQHSSSLS